MVQTIFVFLGIFIIFYVLLNGLIFYSVAEMVQQISCNRYA